MKVCYTKLLARLQNCCGVLFDHSHLYFHKIFTQWEAEALIFKNKTKLQLKFKSFPFFLLNNNISCKVQVLFTFHFCVQSRSRKKKSLSLRRLCKTEVVYLSSSSSSAYHRVTNSIHKINFFFQFHPIRIYNISK